jgi:hypothetical protein
MYVRYWGAADKSAMSAIAKLHTANVIADIVRLDLGASGCKWSAKPRPTMQKQSAPASTRGRHGTMAIPLSSWRSTIPG